MEKIYLLNGRNEYSTPFLKNSCFLYYDIHKNRCCTLFAVNSMTGTRASRKHGNPSTIFYSPDTIKTLYNILAISRSYGIGWRQFLQLMSQTAKEKVEIFY